MEDILRHGLSALGLAFDADTLRRFRAYYERLSRRNDSVNLTAISGEADTARLHFLDCAALLTVADFQGKSVIDVGTGAGFPGIPLRIMEKGISLTLLDSLGKRLDFLGECCSELGLDDVRTVCERAEIAGHLPEFRESFDIAVSRAVARLSVLLELALPFARPGGLFIAMKGPGAEEELEEAQNALEKLGSRCVGIKKYKIEGMDVERVALLIEKTAPMDESYPRRWAKISKKPL